MPGGKNIHHQRKPQGYTIIEVMIVLAVSGVMFVIAANFINGKQERTAFTQGVNETSSRIQDVIEQVVDGRFSDIPLNCQSLGSSTVVSGGSNEQGTNANCVFLGKMMHFNNSGDSTKYSVLSVAGTRTTDPSKVYPTVVDALTITQTVPQSLSVKSVVIKDKNGVNTGQNTDFGFRQGLGVATEDFGGYKSGSQNVSLVYASSNSVSNLNYAQSAVICLTDDTQYAELTVGSSGNDLGVSVKRLGTNAC